MIADRLQELRAARGLTREALAAAACLSPLCIKFLEDGTRTDPRMSTLESLARALDVSPSALFDEEMTK